MSLGLLLYLNLHFPPSKEIYSVFLIDRGFQRNTWNVGHLEIAKEASYKDV